MIKKRVGIITGTRAEYGLLKPLMDLIKNDYDMKVIVTGMHLSPEFGLTYKVIEQEGIKIDEKVEILLSSDTAVGISKSMGLAMISFSEVYERLDLDCIIVLGDRYEIFAAVTAATMAQIPVVHLHGGETTEGAYDEAIRHSITKMSHLHFTSTEEYRKRVIQLGENPETVFNTGAIGIDNIMNVELLSKEKVEESINFKLDKPYGMVTFHPVTLEVNNSKEQVKNLIKALDKYKDMKFIITKANADNDGRIINKLLEEYEKENSDRIILFTSMGQLRYLSAMKYCTMVIGNSSSGIIEAPSFRVPTINIGDRQKGRIQAKSIINCEPTESEIVDAIKLAKERYESNYYENIENPYGNGNAAKAIFNEFNKFMSKPINIKKKFYDL